MANEAARVADAVRRIRTIMLCLAAGGAVAALALKGPPAATGFLIGAAASIASFRWFRQLADGIGPQQAAARPRYRLAVLLGARYLVFGAIAYVIVRYFEVNLLAALAGLLVSAAAVIVELLYELVSGA